MATDGGAATVPYAIAKTEHVIAMVRGQQPTVREKLNAAIDSLQRDPRPAGHEETTGFAPEPILQVVVDTRPKYVLMYFIDDTLKRVSVIAIAPSFARG
jgi:hypothetical protein